MNLLAETVEFLANHGMSKNDVAFVGSADGRLAISWDDFERVADIEYSNGFGGQEIAADLVVVGSRWWIEREEYDGSEGWAFKTMPLRAVDSQQFSRVTGDDAWRSLADINSGWDA